MVGFAADDGSRGSVAVTAAEAIKVLRLIQNGSAGWTAIDREDAIDLAVAALQLSELLIACARMPGTCAHCGHERTEACS